MQGATLLECMESRFAGHRPRMGSANSSDTLNGELERHSRVLFALTMRAMDGVAGDLSPSAVRALLALDEYGECKLAQLAHELLLSQSATSRLVDRLVDDGLVARRTPPDSRREVRLSPTATGRRTTRRVLQRRQQAIGKVLTRMDPHDVTRLANGLAAFASAART
jgi:DNA-binding MarR family transcriptional regulator